LGDRASFYAALRNFYFGLGKRNLALALPQFPLFLAIASAQERYLISKSPQPHTAQTNHVSTVLPRNFSSFHCIGLSAWQFRQKASGSLFFFMIVNSDSG